MNTARPTSEALSVLLNEEPVGTLVWLAPDKTVFTLADSYVRKPNRPTMTFFFSTKDPDQLSEVVWRSNLVLAPFFSNLLPEGPLRTYLAELNKVNPQREYFLLKALKDDLPGAIRLVPSTESASGVTDFESAEDTAPSETLKFSLGGVQLKFSALLDASGGLTIPVQGIGGSWIVKLASHQYQHVPENEYSMMELARLCGIEVPPVELKSSSAIRGLPTSLPEHFDTCIAIKRFDREETRRIHIEDFCQVFNVSTLDKYGNNHGNQFNYNHMAALIWRYLGERDLVEFLRRLVFNIGICNTDMHLKNWSLIYRDGVTPRLSPAYDFVSTKAYVKHDELALRLGDAATMSRVGMQSFQSLIKAAKLPPHLVLETVEQFVYTFLGNWVKYQNDLPVPQMIRESINQHLKTVPLFSYRSSFAGSPLDLI